MARIKGAMHTRKRHKKILKLAKGYRGGRSRLFRTANEAVMESGLINNIKSYKPCRMAGINTDKNRFLFSSL